MPKIGQTGYSVLQAISELVDNSIDARENEKVLTVEIFFDNNKGTVEISDDGVGMNEQTAANSMKLAHSAKKNKLGEFGLGLKTAATSLGRSFQIITTQKGNDEEYIVEYDEDKWLKSGDWTKHEMKIKSGVDKKRSGTTIRIKDLHFKHYGNLPGNIRKDLATRFAPFIENGEVEIKVNTKWCKPEALDLKTEYYPDADGKEPFRLKLESGNEVYGWRGLLKKGSINEYGFRVFRRGRLIMQFAKLGFNPHPEARQIVGEIHLDHVPVTHNKREFIEESPLYREINNEEGIFWKFMKDLVREARTSERKTRIDQGVLDKMEIQTDNIMKAIKNIPQLKEYAFPDLKEKVRSKEGENEGLTDLEIEKRDQRDVITIEDEPLPRNEQNRKSKKNQIRKVYYITINGKKFKVVHDFSDLKTDEVLKAVNVDDETGIHVFTNVAFPSFGNTKDEVFYGVWNIAEALAEVMVERNKRSPEEIIKIRDLILKSSSEITLELDDVEKEKKIAERLKKEYEEKMVRIKEIEEKHSDIKFSN